MKSTFFSICFIAAVAVAPELQAQKTFTDGTITYELKMEGNPMLAQMGEMKMDLAFKDAKSSMSMNMMNGLITTNMLLDNTENAKKGLLLMGMMGKNMAVEINNEEFDKYEAQQRKNQEPPKLTEFKNVKKKIAGYKCYKVEATMAGVPEPVTVYICDKIKPMATSQFQMQFPGLNGYPLGIEIKQMGMTIAFNATKISTKTPEDSLFEMTIPDGYEKKTLDELMEMNPGGGGGMFGM